LAGKEKKIISGTTEIIIFEQKTDTINYITSPEGLTAVESTSNPDGPEWYWVFTDHTSAWFDCAHQPTLSVKLFLLHSVTQ
jgi:hypothetical protein